MDGGFTARARKLGPIQRPKCGRVVETKPRKKHHRPDEPNEHQRNPGSSAALGLPLSVYAGSFPRRQFGYLFGCLDAVDILGIQSFTSHYVKSADGLA